MLVLFVWWKLLYKLRYVSALWVRLLGASALVVASTAVMNEMVDVGLTRSSRVARFVRKTVGWLTNVAVGTIGAVAVVGTAGIVGTAVVGSDVVVLVVVCMLSSTGIVGDGLRRDDATRKFATRGSRDVAINLTEFSA